jgi:uncharacterized protein (DUF2164 family)
MSRQYDSLTFEHEVSVDSILEALSLEQVLDWYKEDCGAYFINELINWAKKNNIDLLDKEV